MANVLITSEYFGRFSDAGKKVLTDAGFTVLDNPYGHKFLNPTLILPYVSTADALICDLEKITQEVMDAAPNLKIIARRGVGVDSVDTAYADKRGIEVARTLGVVEAPVAELVMGFLLAFSREIAGMNQSMHRGEWDKQLGRSMEKRSIGLVGMGKIAYEVARRACAFGMEILYTDLVRNERAERDFGARYLPFDELIQRSDFVTLHMPLTEDNRNLFDYETICRMKPEAYLINTARGAIVNEQDLARALKEKKIAGAAIDVYDVEPSEHSVLRECDNCILTPHVGTFTREIFIAMDVAAAGNIVRYWKEHSLAI